MALLWIGHLNNQSQSICALFLISMRVTALWYFYFEKCVVMYFHFEKRVVMYFHFDTGSGTHINENWCAYSAYFHFEKCVTTWKFSFWDVRCEILILRFSFGSVCHDSPAKVTDQMLVWVFHRGIECHHASLCVPRLFDMCAMTPELTCKRDWPGPNSASNTSSESFLRSPEPIAAHPKMNLFLLTYTFHTCTYVCVCIYVGLCAYIRTPSVLPRTPKRLCWCWACTSRHVYIFVCTFICVCVCVCAVSMCVYACVCAWVYRHSIYMCICAYMCVYS